MVLEDVTLYEALVQFASIGWKFFFALVPPPDYWDGKGCFVISLAMIHLLVSFSFVYWVSFAVPVFALISGSHTHPNHGMCGS